MASTVWRGYITFGLISIPVRLFRAARAERVSLRRLHRTVPDEPQAPENRPDALLEERPPMKAGAASAKVVPAKDSAPFAEQSFTASALRPVQQVSVRAGTGEVLPERSIVKGYEYEKNRFVALEPDELKSVAPKTSTDMAIEEFVELAEIDPVYFETSYYVAPEQAGEKAYALLYRAMQTTGLAAIAQFAMHTREHVTVLRPGKTGLLAHTMFFASEVRSEEEYRADANLVAAKELTLAETLIRSLTARFEPQKYRDSYRERLESIIAKRVQGQPISVPQTAKRQAEVVDIADALRQSLANLKKPPASEERAEKSKETSRQRGGKMSRGAGQR